MGDIDEPHWLSLSARRCHTSGCRPAAGEKPLLLGELAGCCEIDGMIEARNSPNTSSIQVRVVDMTVHAALPHTLADFLHLLGGIAADRVHTEPSPGSASLEDWQLARQRGLVCELVDGTLVEKATGLYESLIAACLIRYFGVASREGRIGITGGEQGFIRLPGGG